MPTGYTNMIDRDAKMTTTRWIMEGLARAFGVCVTLREENMDLTEDAIKQKIVESGQYDINWHQRELEKAKEKQKVIASRTPADWEIAWRKHEARKLKANKKSITEAEKLAKRHNEVKLDLQKIVNNTTDETTEAIAKYGLEQLRITKSETEPFIQKPEILEEYMSKSICDNARDINYHTKELAEAKERMNSRIKAYSKLRKEVDRILKESR